MSHFLCRRAHDHGAAGEQQEEHLQEYVRPAALTERKLNTYGWVYDMYSGEITIVKTTVTGKAGPETTLKRSRGRL
jgi:carbonic anhydrase